jgi:Glycosyltransferase family 87
LALTDIALQARTSQVATQLLFKRAAAIVLLIALAMLLAVRGIAPAVSTLDSDFPSYLTAAKIVADGGNAARLYDISWFEEQMRVYRIGEPSQGKFSPFPPPTALLLVPLTPLSPQNALRVMTTVSVFGLVCSVLLLMRILSWNFINTAVFVLLSGYAIQNGLRFGQPYILVSLCCILGFHAYLERRPLRAGISIGLFAPIKYFPVVILIYFAFRREWKVALGGAITVLAVAALSIGVLGWKVHEEFLASILGNHLVGIMGMQDPFTASFQSFDSLFRRLFIFDAVSNPQPLAALPLLHSIGVPVTKALILLAAIAALTKLARGGPAAAAAPSIGLLGVVTLLLAPATATYHFVLLWLPVGLLINFFLLERAPAYAYFLLGAYALIGFFPYRYSAPFEGRGGLTVLAYPRLILLLAMFTGCIHFIGKRWTPTRA